MPIFPAKPMSWSPAPTRASSNPNSPPGLWFRQKLLLPVARQVWSLPAAARVPHLVRRVLASHELDNTGWGTSFKLVLTALVAVLVTSWALALDRLIVIFVHPKA